MHKLKDGSIKPIAHASRTFLQVKKNYSMIENESLGIVFALNKFHRFLHERRFTLQTDHRPLLAIFGSKKGLPTHTVDRLQWWEPSYWITVSGWNSCHQVNCHKLIQKNSEPLDDMVTASLQEKVKIKKILCNTVQEQPVTLEEIKKNLIVEMKKKLKDNRIWGIFNLQWHSHVQRKRSGTFITTETNS